MFTIDPPMPQDTPPREATWQGDFHRYIQRAMAAEAKCDYQRAQACATIATAFAVAKVNLVEEENEVNR